MKFKWEPVALMVILMALGVWLVWSSKPRIYGLEPREGSHTIELRVGNSRGIVEITPPLAGSTPAQGHRFRVLLRDGYESPEMSDAEFKKAYGERTHADALDRSENPLFRLLNITSWTSLIWVVVGLGGQIAFFGRMLIQWLASEKSRASVVPPAFWWLSLGGGVALFVYFVWRQDFVGVLGQSSGVVIYARNIRLIAKQRRRDAELARG